MKTRKKKDTSDTAVIEGFFKHNELDTQTPQPVLRASAFFYVLESTNVHTEFLWFNYWLHKRGIDGLTLLATLRTASGQSVHTESCPIDYPGARTLRVRDLLARANLTTPFEGSLEIEIISPVDLVIPYPAIIGRYYGDNWHTTVHSYSRILSESSGDLPDRLESLQRTSEGNWTIHPDASIDNFFVIHNGPHAVAPHDLSLTLTNIQGERIVATYPDTTYAPYETRVFHPDELLDITGHLNGSVGNLDVQTLVSGVFPRMLCGMRRRSDGAMSVDHSNFNYIGETGRNDSLPADKGGTRKPLGFVVPTFTNAKWACYADFYPTYPDRNYTATLRTKTAEGQEVARAEVMLGGIGSPGIVRIPVSEMIKPYDNAGALDFTITHASRVPRRFHMGIHYEYNGGLPAFLIDGPMPYTATGHTHRWFPVLETTDMKTFVFISNQVFDLASPVNLTYDLWVHNAHGDEPLHTQFKLDAGATLASSAEELVPGLQDFLGNEAGWVYLQATPLSMSVIHYIIVKGNDSLTADHAL